MTTVLSFLIGILIGGGVGWLAGYIMSIDR